MKVLVLTPHLSQGGGVTNYYNALNLDELPNIEYFSVNNPNTVSLFSKLFSSLFIYSKFIKQVSRYDLIHINPSLNAKSFYRDMLFISLSRLFKRKVLVFFRGWENTYEDKIKSSVFKKYIFLHTYAKADRYIVLSNEFKNKLLALGVNTNKPFHIETTVADSSQISHFDLNDKINSSKEKLEFLFISRVLKEKGVYLAIDAYHQCKKDFPSINMSLTIAGDGEELEAARNYVSQEKISDITFPGYVSGEEKYQILNSAHILLFPSYYGEGLPNCVLEGMLYGMPIISRINAGIPDVVENSINGFITSSIASKDFAKFITILINDNVLYKRVAQANHLKAMSLFTIDKVKSRILGIYELM